MHWHFMHLSQRCCSQSEWGTIRISHDPRGIHSPVKPCVVDLALGQCWKRLSNNRKLGVDKNNERQSLEIDVTFSCYRVCRMTARVVNVWTSKMLQLPCCIKIVKFTVRLELSPWYQNAFIFEYRRNYMVPWAWMTGKWCICARVRPRRESVP